MVPACVKRKIKIWNTNFQKIALLGWGPSFFACSFLMACVGANDGHLHLLPRRPSKIKVVVDEIYKNNSSAPRLPTKVDVYVFKIALIFVNRVGVPKAVRPQTKFQKHIIKQQFWSCAKLVIKKNVFWATCPGGACSKFNVSWCVFKSRVAFALANVGVSTRRKSGLLWKRKLHFKNAFAQ